MNKVIVMNITYTAEKKFTQEQVQALFLSVGWVSGEYPSRLYKALKHSSTVITAWDGEQLIGLVRVLDDSEMVKEKYKNYLYIEVMPEERKNASFYEKHGFQIMQDGVAMQMCNFLDRR